MIYIGIDPGASGGIAAIDDRRVLEAWALSELSDREVFNVLAGLSDSNLCTAVLERVRSSPQMGVVSAFTFGRGYGTLRMALTAAAIPFDEVLPAKWQQVLGCLTKGDKNVSKRRAQDLFPSIIVTHANADALLLAAYCRRIEHRPELTHGKEEGRRRKKGR